jgi:nucleoside-diphosphate-sugar epimerase
VYCSSFSVYGVAMLPRGAVVDERTPMEPHPEKRDVYAHTKHRQEELIWQYHREKGVPLVVLRPGVIYGPGGGAPMSSRVGINLFGLFLHLGRRNVLPLTYVDNCAEAFVCAAKNSQFNGEIYNVVDDDLIDAREFLNRYRNEVKKLPYITVPFAATRLMSWAVEKYHDYSRGQLPAIFTRYKTDSMWKGNTFDNRTLKSIGWRPLVSTEEGLRRHFAHLATR